MSASVMSQTWRPIKVLVVTAEELSDEISVDPRYRELWALIQERQRPRGMIKVDLREGRIDRERLLAAIAELPPLAATQEIQLPPEMDTPRISVVVSTLFERLEEMQACLASLAAISYPNFEVIVVDNRGADSPPIALPGVKVVREPKAGLSAARNRGLAEASGEIVAFTDDDVIVQPEWLLAIAARMQAHPDEVCVTGLAIPSELETPAQVALEEYYGGFGGPRIFEPVCHRLRNPPGIGSPLALPLVDAIGDDGRVVRSFSIYSAGSFGLGANMAFRTATLREMGGFDVALGAGTPAHGGEDLLMFVRLAWRGYALGFEPASMVRHTHRRDEEALRRQVAGYGVGWTALLMASAFDDPRHLGRMLGTVPRGVRAIVGGYVQRIRSTGNQAQPGEAANAREDRTLMIELAQLELRGMARGPFAYLRGRLAWSS